MSLLLGMITDARVHHRSPAEVAGVELSSAYLPGVYEYADGGNVYLVVVSPSGKGDVEAFSLDMRGERIFARQLDVPPQDYLRWIWGRNKEVLLDERPEVLKKLVEVAMRVATEYPSNLWESGDE